MKRILLVAVLSLTAALVIPSAVAPAAQKTPSPDAKLEKVFRKKNVTIAVTDSGLGGLSVLAEAAARMKTAGTFERADFLFFNALFSAEGGYNSLQTRGEKIAIFQSALGGLEKRYHPDLILVACNTLSVLLEDTLFARRTKTPIVGIVAAGVDLMAEALQAEPGSSVIIFGTPTTIAEGAHRRALEDRGFAADRVITQPCPELESFIERDWAGSETSLLISGFVEEALQKLPSPRPSVYASLNCTHYGYSLPLWESAFAAAGLKPAAILNPNSRMIDFLFAPGRAGRFPATAVSARVVSMIEIGPEKREALGGWLARTSPETAEALRAYDLVPDLFRWKSGS